MGFTSGNKAKSFRESWGMGLLLIFCPEDQNNYNNNSAIVEKNKLFSSSPSSSSSPNSSISSSPSSSVIRRSNSNRLLTKAQSTISICAFLVFITLLLFTLSTFEPTTTNRNNHPRRFLSQNPENNLKPKPKTNNNHSLWSSPWFGTMWKQKPELGSKSNTRFTSALQGLGTLYRRGTRAMADLVVGHVSEDLREGEIRFFLRFLHRSGLTARADVVFVFGSNSSRFDSVIREENESFLKLVNEYKRLNKTTSRKPSSSFDVTQFKLGKKKEIGEPLWGKRSRTSSNFSDSNELTQLSYGSVLGFEASELDPENSLSGFLDHVPLSMRRWACYPMLLGRVRRNFKHIMLVDVKSLVVLGDPLGLVRNRSPESVFLFTKPETSSNSKHGKRNSDKTQSHCQVNSAIITGGARGIRRLSNAMLTEIVRAATQQHKKKNSLTESVILNQLVGNEFLLNNVKFIKSVDSVPDAGSLVRLGHNSAALHTVVQRGNSNDYDVINSIIMNQICSSEVDSSVYSDC